MNDIYFTTTCGKLVTNHDIAKAAIINGDTVDEYNLDEVRKYVSTCKGIVKEINPSIKVCLQNGDKITAVKLYYYRHHGITLNDAKKVIDDMEAKMRLGILKKEETKMDNEVWMNYTVGDQVRYARTGQLGFIKEVNEVSQTYTVEFDGVEYSVTEDELN